MIETSSNSYYSQFDKAKTILVEPVDYATTERNYKLGVIASYRDNPLQDRKQQLATFVPFMTNYLMQLGTNYEFCIIVVEQSDDDRKFNRGKLLNVGFMLAKEQGCDYCIFHDIDLCPDDNMLGYYGLFPYAPLHLAAVWPKYQHLELFFGGVCSLSMEQFTILDGYPNDFWGWGGEDEELYHRIVDHNMMILIPSKGSFVELEHIHTKTIPDAVNQKRFDQIAQRKHQVQSNGISNLQLTKLYEPEKLNSHASKYLVVL